MGLAVADMLAGEALAQGVLAALVGRSVHGQGALVETSLIEAALSFQFEVLTTFLNDGGRRPDRAGQGGAHAYIGAPYGIYATKDGWLALAMTPSLGRLGNLLGIDLTGSGDPRGNRDAIKATIAAITPTRTTADWLAVLQPADIWAAEVLDWPALMANPVWQQLGMSHPVQSGGFAMTTIRGPLRLNGATLGSDKAAPALGADTDRILQELAPRKAARG